MVTTPKLWTLEEVEHGGPDGLWEIIEGVLIEMPPAGGRHGRMGMKLGTAISYHVDSRKLGYVYDAQTGFVLSREPLTLRVPDVAFLRADRVPTGFDGGGMLQIAPDLVVEMLSPSDSAGNVLAKIGMWLEAGARMVWQVDPESETVTIYHHVWPPQVLTGDEALDGGDVLPGFSLPVSTIFAL